MPKAPKSVVIQWWRRDRPDVLSAAAKGGYELVMSPADQLYFDYQPGPRRAWRALGRQ